MKVWTGSLTSCSKIFLTGHSRKLCLKPNWNMASNILGCRGTPRRSDSARTLSRMRVGGLQCLEFQESIGKLVESWKGYMLDRDLASDRLRAWGRIVRYDDVVETAQRSGARSSSK